MTRKIMYEKCEFTPVLSRGFKTFNHVSNHVRHRVWSRSWVTLIWRVTCHSVSHVLFHLRRDQLNLLRFLNSLCDFLPASHGVKLVGTPRSHGRSGGLSQTLETEIQSITQAVSSVVQCEDRGVERCSSDASSEILQRLRDERQAERERYNKRLRPLVDAARYCRFMESLIHTQMNGDVVALREAQTDIPRL